MAKRTKPNYSVVWSETGSATKPADSSIRAGWSGGTKPPAEWMNWVQNRQDGYLAYLNQAGIPEWDSTSSYEGSFSYVQGADNNVYKCLVSNTNKDPIDQPANASYWKIAFIANTDQITRAVGIASAPTYSFEGDTNTGVYSTGADGVGVATGGVKRLEVNNSGAAVSGTLSATGKATFASPDASSNTTEGATTAWVRGYVGTGAVIQSQMATSSTQVTVSNATPWDNTIPQITEGQSILSGSITPSSSSNKIRVTANIPCFAANAHEAGGIIHVHKVGTTSAIAAATFYTALANEVPGLRQTITVIQEFVAGTTSPIGVEIRAGNVWGGFVINPAVLGGVQATKLLIEEIRV